MSVVTEQINSLEQLAELDNSLRGVEETIKKEDAQLFELTSGLQKLETSLAREKEDSLKTDKSRSDIHGELRNMMQQLDMSRDKLGRSRTERESNAAQREAEELRRLIRDKEEEANRVEIQAGQRAQIVETQQAEEKRIREELGANEGGNRARRDAAANEREALTVKREAIAKTLPPIMFRKYEQVRQKRGSGLARTSNGTCQACNMQLPPQLFHRLRREPLIEQCPSCNRLIYFLFDEVAEAAAAAAREAAKPAPKAPAKPRATKASKAAAAAAAAASAEAASSDASEEASSPRSQAEQGSQAEHGSQAEQAEAPQEAAKESTPA